jgi:ribosome-binding factor A
MSSRRTIRVSELIRKELSTLISRCVDFEGLLVTISAIEVSPDLKQSYVYISVIDPKTDREHVLNLLNEHRGEWQRVIGKRISSKFSPRLNFRFDQAMERGDRVMDILRKIEDEKSDGEDLNGH